MKLFALYHVLFRSIDSDENGIFALLFISPIFFCPQLLTADQGQNYKLIEYQSSQVIKQIHLTIWTNTK